MALERQGMRELVLEAERLAFKLTGYIEKGECSVQNHAL
jgi:hypothetical protein